MLHMLRGKGAAMQHGCRSWPVLPLRVGKKSSTAQHTQSTWEVERVEGLVCDSGADAVQPAGEGMKQQQHKGRVYCSQLTAATRIQGAAQPPGAVHMYRYNARTSCACSAPAAP